MLALAEKQMLINALGHVVLDEVRLAFEPFAKRVERIERMLGDLPVVTNGIDGKDGKDGKDADLKEVAVMLERAMADTHAWVGDVIAKAIEDLPKPERGERGEKGDKGDPGEPGKDGSNGRDGIDGTSVALDDIRTLLADLVAKALGDAPVPRNCTGGYIDRAGHLFLSFSDGSNSDLGEVVGRDGKDCDLAAVRAQVSDFLATIEKPKDGKDGKDGVGFDDVELEYDGARKLSFTFFKSDEAKAKSFEYRLPIPLFRNLWAEGRYEKSDIVYRDGSMWIAKEDTEGVPGQPASNWMLCTKRGRDGKDGKPQK